MARLCERPGCSERGAVAYGFDADRLLVWLAAFDPDAERTRAGVLCKRHADSMVVPVGWTLDDTVIRGQPCSRRHERHGASASRAARRHGDASPPRWRTNFRCRRTRPRRSPS